MQPFVIGIAGGTGSGKTTIALRVVDAVPENTVHRIEHDSYYRDRPDLTFDERTKLNYDHPQSLETELLVTHLRALRAGQAVDMPAYDFKAHRRMPETMRIEARPIIVVEGILVLAEPDLRDLLDLKIFVDTDADIRVLRRIRRDIEQRGRDFDSIRKQYYETVRPMHLRFVEPSKRWADLIIPEGGNRNMALDVLTTKIMAVVSGGQFPQPCP